MQAWQDCRSGDPACEEAACALDAHLFPSGPSLVRRSHLPPLPSRCGGCSAWPAPRPWRRPTLSPSNPSPPSVPRWPRLSPTIPGRSYDWSLSFTRGFPLPMGAAPVQKSSRSSSAGALASLMTQVEAFGGTVTSVSGAGLEAVFGTPMAHEDDPERAVRVAYLAQSDGGCANGGMTIRIGVETGPAVIGTDRPGLRGRGGGLEEPSALASVAMDASL